MLGLSKPFSEGSPFLRLWPLDPNLESRDEGPLAAESKADLQSSPVESPLILRLSVDVRSYDQFLKTGTRGRTEKFIFSTG